jgi:hypothetical protein
MSVAATNTSQMNGPLQFDTRAQTDQLKNRFRKEFCQFSDDAKSSLGRAVMLPLTKVFQTVASGGARTFERKSIDIAIFSRRQHR